VRRHLDAGQSLWFGGGNLDVILVTAHRDSDAIRYVQSYGQSIKALAPLTLLISPDHPHGHVTLCS
jgi:hypothetical protein